MCLCVCERENSNLVSCRHYGHHRELVHFHFCDSHCGQQADLRWAHMSAFGQNTLSTLYVMTNGPETHIYEVCFMISSTITVDQTKAFIYKCKQLLLQLMLLHVDMLYPVFVTFISKNHSISYMKLCISYTYSYVFHFYIRQ